MKRRISWRRHTAKRKQSRWQQRVIPSAMPMVLLGLIMRKEFVKYLDAEEKRILYGTGMEQPRGILSCSEEELRESRILQDAKEPTQ